MLRQLRLLELLADAVLVVNAEGLVTDVPTTRSFHTLGLRGDVVGRASLWEVLYPDEPAAAEQFEIHFGQLTAGILPFDVCLDQLPTSVRLGDRFLDVRFVPLSGEHAPDELAIVISDGTQSWAERKRAIENAEFRRVTETLLSNMDAARAFFAETDWLLVKVAETSGPARPPAYPEGKPGLLWLRRGGRPRPRGRGSHRRR